MSWKLIRPVGLAGLICLMVPGVYAAEVAQASAAEPSKQPLSDDDPTIRAWGADYPEYVEMYMEMKDTSQPTEFGGNVPYSKLIRFPQLTELWGGYAFALDFNEERGHYYSQIDQLESKRNDKAFLNANGLTKFNGQPGACMNCHSGWTPALIREKGWEGFNRTPYWEIVDELKQKHGDGIHGAEMGSTCADCHSPDEDMTLRVTRPAYIDAMVQRGYEADPKTGLKGSTAEMRSHVCQQCHVEYYFNGPDKVLTFPWTEWPKDEPFRIEMMEAYYDKVRDAGGFKADWTHKTTKAPMLKMQHPEAEMASSGRHTREGISCADCHMPVVEKDGKEVTQHRIDSPLNELTACKSCHADQNEAEIRTMVQDIQRYTARRLNRAESAILALIADTKTVRHALAQQSPFQSISDAAEREAAISTELEPVLEAHRRSSMRWDFVGAENSTGIHSPREAWRVLDQAVELAREGQQSLLQIAESHGIELELTENGVVPAAPAPIHDDEVVGTPPPGVTQGPDQYYSPKKAAQAAE